MSGGERDPSPPFGNSYHGRKNSDGQHWRAIAHSHQMWSLRIRETTQESGRHMTGIAPDVRLSEPLDDGQRWILENAHGEKIGVSADVATFITAMQDSTDLYEVNRRFGKCKKGHRFFYPDSMCSSTRNRNRDTRMRLPISKKTD